jgi:hypothetical protein
MYNLPTLAKNIKNNDGAGANAEISQSLLERQ